MKPDLSVGSPLPRFERWCARAALAVALACALPAAASPGSIWPAPGQPGQLLLRDHLDPPALKSSRIQMLSDCDPCWGEEIEYSAFNRQDQHFAARRYDGHRITLIVPLQHSRQDEATDDRLRVLVDRLDLLHAAYAELMDWEPARTSDPLGRHLFALLPDEPSWFYGLAYAPGDASEYSNAVLAERALDDDILSNVWVHELAHNFDALHFWDYGPDPAHDWTTVLQTWFARRQARMWEVGRSSWRQFESQWLHNHLQRYVDNPDLDWAQCAAQVPRPEACAASQAMFLPGLLMVEAGRHLDGSVLKAWMATGLARQTDGVSLPTPQQRSDAQLGVLAEMSQTDLRCLADFARWHRGAALDGASAQFDDLFPACRDDDADGFDRLQGDCDDAEASQFPGAGEVADGLDNDCSGVVDDLPFAESEVAGGDFQDGLWGGTPVPAAPVVLHGSLQERAQGQPLDTDSVAPAEWLQGNLLIRLCSAGASLRMAGVADNGVGYGPLAGVDGAGCTQRMSSSETWRSLMVERAAGTSAGGDYSLLLASLPASEDDFEQRPRLVLERGADQRIRARAAGGFPLHQPPGAELRWWLSGRGFVQAQPAASAAAWTAPPLQASDFEASGAPLRVRAQLWADGMPVGEPSPPYLLPDASFLATVTPDSAVSGAWYAPSHSGEGFYLERLDDGTLVVSWFTYEVGDWNRPIGQGRQLWLGNALAPDGARVRGPLYRFRGGRFGTALDPDLVEPVEVGWIEFAFASAERATVHFEVEGRSGEFAIQPLTRLDTGPAALGLSGSWYDPEHSGQGLFVQELANRQLAAVFYSFDARGQPAWRLLNGVAAADGTVQFAEAPLGTMGGLFGRGFRPSSVQYAREGEAELQLGCGSGRFTILQPGIDAASHTLELVRLSRPSGVVCRLTP